MKTKNLFKIIVLLVFLAICARPVFAVIEIPNDTSVGTWEDGTYTLTTSVNEGLVVMEENLILTADAGVTVTGTGASQSVGVSINGVRKITVQNLTIVNFETGISISNPYDGQIHNEWMAEGEHIIENNEINSCPHGIRMISNSNTIRSDNDINTCQYGIYIGGSENNTVTGNTIDASITGINIGSGPQGGQGEKASLNNTVSGNTVTGDSTTGSSSGINIGFADEIVVSNNTITNYNSGIKITSSIDTGGGTSTGHQITGNDISNNFFGIHVFASRNHVIADNDIMSNNATGVSGGIWIQASNNNTLMDNTVTGDGDSVYGIYLGPNSDGIGSEQNTVTGNTCSNNNDGIRLISSHNNTLTNNTFSGNRVYGISLTNSDNNTLTNNTVSDNGSYGIYLNPSTNNQINNNNFINNNGGSIQALVNAGCTGNNFDGNHWSDHTGPDDVPAPDGDGIVDGPYVISVDPPAQDGTPYTTQDGWVVDMPPEITCPGNTTIEAMEPEGVPIEDDRIQAFLGGVSATDDVDPEEDIIIDHDAPALFPPGDTTVTFSATDTFGNTSTCQSTVTVEEAAESYLKIIPRVINREGRLNRILAVIRFPAGTTAEDIDIGLPLMLYPGDSDGEVEASNQRIITWSRWGVERVSVFACFNKDDVVGLIEDGPVEMMLIGRFTDGQYFYGFDDVWVISWSWCWW